MTTPAPKSRPESGHGRPGGRLGELLRALEANRFRPKRPVRIVPTVWVPIEGEVH